MCKACGVKVWVEEASPGDIQGTMTDGLVEVIGVSCDSCPTVYPWAGYPQTDSWQDLGRPQHFTKRDFH